MNTTLVIFASLLGFAASGSAIAKFLKVPQIMASMAHVSVKPGLVPILGVLEVLGTLGLVLGIWFQSLGVLSAVCLALYFLGAVGSHIKAQSKIADSLPAFMIMLIAIAVSYLEILR
jgi:hypothetical protein